MDAGYLLFLIFGIMAFWLLLFLFGVGIPYWVTQGILYKFSKKKDEDNETVEVTVE